jgi:hypothetical protein
VVIVLGIEIDLDPAVALVPIAVDAGLGFLYTLAGWERLLLVTRFSG